MKHESFETTGFWLAFAAIVSFLFLPLLLIHGYEVTEASITRDGAGEVAVGIAVIVRAAGRRVLTTAVSNVLRTTFATFSRAAGRTMMRRLARMLVRILFGAFTREALAKPKPSGAAQGVQERRRPWLPLGLGMLGLTLSFGGILWVVPAGEAAAVLGDGALHPAIAAVLAGLPLGVYIALNYAAARRLGVALSCNTAFDGLVLQAYFTGAGSFLPMTTDVEYEGSDRAKMWVAVVAIVGTYLVHLVLDLLAGLTGIYALQFAASVFLIYCFVYAFPISPLEGHDIWSESKLMWAAVWLPILVSFFFSMPEAFTQVL